MMFRIGSVVIAVSVVFALATPARAEDSAVLPAPPALPDLPAPTQAPLPQEPETQVPPPSPPQEAVPLPSPPAKWRRQPMLAGGLVLGVGTPAGWVGGTLSLSPIDRFVIGAEFGLGTNGIQSALMLHAYPMDTAKNSSSVGRAGGGLGVSTGTYADHSILKQGADLIYFRRAWFLNAEVSMLAWHRTGFEFEFALGGAILLNRGDGICTRSANCTPLGFDPYFAFRFRFGGWL